MFADVLRPTLAAGLAVFLRAATPAWADNHSSTGTDSEAATESTTSEGTADATPVEPKYVLGDVVLGSEDAPVTIIEYASFTCPHCANFHINTWPQVKENYVDTGKVRFILREVYFDKYGLWASMTARCGGAEGFYPLADTFLKTQQTWTRSPDIDHAIHQIGRRAGLSNERLEACLGDRDYARALLDEYKKNAEADEIRSTPTFIINGEKHSGNKSYEEFSAILDGLL